MTFYLDHGRVHVGDLARTTEDAFTAWVSDRAAGLDAIMLAPTRDLVADLNRRARQHRLRHAAQLGREVQLGDGNQASIGDVIITRTNDRRLRLSASDWVKNGDRWTISEVGKHGELTVRHQRSRLTTRLPADYVGTSTGLGYATTIHGAQGVSADAMHGLLTGQESRQQLYTMLTRGRHSNHLYLQVVGDGDPHSVIRPDAVAPRTPTETLQQILARDDSPTSATTTLRELHDPAARLFDAVQRYTDSLHAAAEQLLGPQVVADLDTIDQYIPGLTDEPAWPTLRAHLLDLAAETGDHPLRHLYDAAFGRDLSTAGDMAAVLRWRLPETTASDHRPLPWVPGIPTGLQVNPVWGDYLTKRSQLIARPRRPRPRTSQPIRRCTRLVAHGQPPERHTPRGGGRLARRERHQPPRPTSNRRTSARTPSRPLETTPRPSRRQRTLTPPRPRPTASEPAGTPAPTR